MDVMELRRMVMAQMASGANYISGSFTIPDDATGTYTFQIGKTFNKYIYIIEATDESKALILNSGQASAKAYMFMGLYPKTSVNNVENNYTSAYQRVNPSNGNVDMAANSGAILTSSSIGIIQGTFMSGAFYLYRGCTYNYLVFEIK